MNRNIMIVGYWENNLGDDCFLEIFNQRYPNSTIYLLTQKKYKKVYQYPQVRVICYDDWYYRIMNALLRFLGLPSLFYAKYSKKCDTAVILSGSYFMEDNFWRRSLSNLDTMRKNVKHTFVIGTNFGPYKSNDYIEGYRQFFEQCDDVCFRDQSSFELFKDLSHVRMAPDIVLGMDVRPTKKEKRLIISVIDCNKSEILAQYEQDYIAKMKEITHTYLNLGYFVTLFSFSEKQGDVKACEQIAQDIKNERLEIFNHNNVALSLEKMSTAQLVVATRFHAMILGWVFDSHVYPIVYSKKMSNVIDDLGYSGEYCEVSDIKDLDCNRLVEVLQQQNPIASSLFILAKNQFSAFDSHWRNDHE
jgi:colanic acid/amylovoran biosynthesis protein